MRMFLAAAVVGFCNVCTAQTTMGSIPMWTTINQVNNLSLKMADDAVINAGKRDSTRSTSVPLTSTPAMLSTVTNAPSDGPSMPAKLAAYYPSDKRSEAERTFKEILDGYRKIESQFGIPNNDLAGAVAAFVAGSWMAYQDKSFPDQNFLPLVNQVRGIIRSNADFALSTAAERREMYEQMAILGTFLALSRERLQKQPNAATSANIRSAAKSYLEGFLKTDANRVQITANGLVLK
jgi:hypothetical protein